MLTVFFTAIPNLNLEFNLNCIKALKIQLVDEYKIMYSLTDLIFFSNEELQSYCFFVVQ